jgi:hypothetical protein
MSTRHRASITFILITLGLDALGVGIIAPIVPGWYDSSRTCRRSARHPGSAR